MDAGTRKSYVAGCASYMKNSTQRLCRHDQEEATEVWRIRVVVMSGAISEQADAPDRGVA